MTNQPSPAVARAAARNTAPAKTDKLEALRTAAGIVRSLEHEINDLETRLAESKAMLRVMYHETLPTLLDAAGVDRIGIPANGNMPAIDYKMTPYFSANIAASWPQDKREEAFDLLKQLKAEDLIKTEVSAKLPKGNLALAEKLIAAAKKLNIETALKKSVAHNTLTAWLRELYLDRHQSLPQSSLDKLGASVGRACWPQERKE